MAASENGHQQVVELLLKEKADPNIQDSNSQTALMVASHNGHQQVVEILLKEKADPNIQDNDGETALVAASENGHHQVVDRKTQGGKLVVAVRASVSMSLIGMISESNKITLPFILKVERTEIEMCPKLVTTKISIDKQSDMVTSTMHMIMHTDKQTNNNQSICHISPPGMNRSGGRTTVLVRDRVMIGLRGGPGESVCGGPGESVLTGESSGFSAIESSPFGKLSVA